MDTAVTPTPAAALLNDAATKRVVIKLGSALLVENGALTQRRLQGICRDIAALRAQGRDVVVISSGAIALGRPALRLDHRPRTLADAQAAAAIGQIALSNAWRDALGGEGLTAAQLLLTLDDLEGRRTYLNARETLERLLAFGIIPVINENDSTATEEIRFGDNDRLAARVAQMLGANVLILFSDIDGLYTADPNLDQTAQLIAEIPALTSDIQAMAGAARPDGLGSGGMATKLAAARIATDAGVAMVIASGHAERPIDALLNGARASLFHPARSRRDARKLWIAGRLHLRGSISVDKGAERALAVGKSLLPAGIVSVQGSFGRGDAIAVHDEAGRLVARGLCAYDSEEMQRIKGLQSKDIGAQLGYDRGPACIHRDDLVLESTT